MYKSMLQRSNQHALMHSQTQIRASWQMGQMHQIGNELSQEFLFKKEEVVPCNAQSVSLGRQSVMDCALSMEPTFNCCHDIGQASCPGGRASSEGCSAAQKHALSSLSINEPLLGVCCRAKLLDLMA